MQKLDEMIHRFKKCEQGFSVIYVLQPCRNGLLLAASHNSDGELKRLT